MADPNPLQILADHFAEEPAPDAGAELESAFLARVKAENMAPAPAIPEDFDPMRLVGEPPKPSPGSQIVYGAETIALPPELAGDATEAARFASWARQEGLSAAQVRALVRFEAGRQRAAGGGVEQQEAAWRRESLESFRPDEIREAQGVLKQFGTPELQMFLDSSGLGSRREVIQLMLNIARHSRPGR